MLEFIDTFRRADLVVLESSASMVDLLANEQRGYRPLPTSADELAAFREDVRNMVKERAAEVAAAVFAVDQDTERAISVETVDLGGHVSVVVFTPRRPLRGALLYFHGGGWICGTADMTASVLKGYAASLSLAIASVDYRLAPEHPYPAPADDCERAARWWVERCTKELRLERVIISGDSAGAHLAAVTTVRMRQRHGHEFAGVLLTCGLFDFRNGLPSRMMLEGRRLGPDASHCAYYARAFLPSPELASEPDVSPLLADLKDMPAALFSAATLDPLLDDSLLMHARWRMAGNRAYLAVYRGCPHGFELLTPAGRESAAYFALSRSFIAACLEGKA
jgi:acetyl esterase